MIPHKPTRRKHFQLPVILFLGVLIMAGMGAKSMVVNHTYARESAKVTSPSESIAQPYQAKIDQETDVAHLAQVGSNLLAKNLPMYAAMNFKRASELDKNYRDAAYGWAYALVQSDQTNLLASGHSEAVHEALNRVESIDPHYIPALKLERLVAEMEDKRDVIQTIDTRLKLLEKSE